MVYYPAQHSSSKSPLQAHTFYLAYTHVAGLGDMKYSSFCFLREISTISIFSLRLRLTGFITVPHVASTFLYFPLITIVG